MGFTLQKKGDDSFLHLHRNTEHQMLSNLNKDIFSKIVRFSDIEMVQH